MEESCWDAGNLNVVNSSKEFTMAHSMAYMMFTRHANRLFKVYGRRCLCPVILAYLLLFGDLLLQYAIECEIASVLVMSFERCGYASPCPNCAAALEYGRGPFYGVDCQGDHSFSQNVCLRQWCEASYEYMQYGTYASYAIHVVYSRGREGSIHTFIPWKFPSGWIWWRILHV